MPFCSYPRALPLVRKLSADEEALWQKVAATIRSLAAGSPGTTLAAPPESPVKSSLTARKSPKKRVAKRPELTLGDSLDGSWEKRLRSGAITPDRSLDLHGYSVDGAYQAIDLALERAWAASERVLLLVTGRARPDAVTSGRGKIRAALTDWLAASRHAPHIAAIRAAHRRHGGPGGVYVILRRR